MLKTVDREMQDYYNNFRRAIGTQADFKRYKKLPMELIERLEENFLKILIAKLVRFFGGGILLAFLIALFLNTVGDYFLRLILS